MKTSPRFLVSVFLLLLAGCGRVDTPMVAVGPDLAFRQLVQQDLSAIDRGAYPSHMTRLNADYAELHRRGLSISPLALVEVKYLLADYRDSLRLTLVKWAAEAKQTDALPVIVRKLRELGAYLPAADCTTLSNAAGARGSEALTALLVDFGEAKWVKTHLPEASRTPKVSAVYTGSDPTKFGNSGWLGNKAFALEAYRSTAPYSVEIRGLHVRAGDVYLLDQGATGGVNTNFSLSRSFATHSGLIVFLEKDGATYPAFFEIAQQGLRVIPLASAFSPEFGYWGEVYRPKQLPEDSHDDAYVTWAKAFGEDVLSQLENRFFYDYSAPPIVSNDQRGIVCSTQTRLFLKRAGVELITSADKVDLRAQASLLSQFQYPLKEYVTPTSILRSGGLNYVGTIDSDRFQTNLTRELIVGGPGNEAPESLGYLFTNLSLDLKKVEAGEFGARYQGLRMAVPLALASGQVRIKAPTGVLAFAKTLDAPLSAAATKVAAALPALLQRSDVPKAFSLGEFSHSAPVRALLKKEMAPIRAWFSDPKAKK